MSNNEKISRHHFLKMAGIAGTAFLLIPLVPFGKVMGTRVTNQNKPVIIKRTNIVGPDGVAFLYPSNPKGFVWKIIL